MATKEENSFADGIRKLNTRGAFYVKGIRLTKRRAQIILDLLDRYKHEYNWTHDEDDSVEQTEADNEMQSAMQWIMNHITKRWSQNEIYSPDKRRVGGKKIKK